MPNLKESTTSFTSLLITRWPIKENMCNKGFAFINFSHPLHLVNFAIEFKGKKWRKFNSNKICDIVYAKMQGRDELMKHFKRNGFAADVTDEMKPILLDEKLRTEVELPRKFLFYFDHLAVRQDFDKGVFTFVV